MKKALYHILIILFAAIFALTLSACDHEKSTEENAERELTAEHAKSILSEGLDKLSETARVGGELIMHNVTYRAARAGGVISYGSSYTDEGNYEIDNLSYIVQVDGGYHLLSDFSSTDPTSGKRYSEKYYESLSEEEYSELSTEHDLVRSLFPFDPSALMESADLRISGTKERTADVTRYEIHFTSSVSKSGETARLGATVVMDDKGILSLKGKVDNEDFEIALHYDVTLSPHSLDYYKYNAPSEEYAAAMKDLVRASALSDYSESHSRLYPALTAAELAAIHDTIINNPYDLECTLYDGTNGAKAPNYGAIREIVYDSPNVDASLLYDALRALEKKVDAPADSAWYAYYRGYFVTAFTGAVDLEYGKEAIIRALLDPDTPSMKGYAPFSTARLEDFCYSTRALSVEYEGRVYHIALIPMKSVIERSFDILDNVAAESTASEGSRRGYGIEDIAFTNEKLSFVLYLPEDGSLRQYMEAFDSSPFFSVDSTVISSNGAIVALEDAPSFRVAHPITLIYRSGNDSGDRSENRREFSISDQELEGQVAAIERNAERLSARDTALIKGAIINVDLLEKLTYLFCNKTSEEDKVVLYDQSMVSTSVIEPIEYPADAPLVTLRAAQAEIAFSTNITYFECNAGRYCHDSYAPSDLGAALAYLRNLADEGTILITAFEYHGEREVPYLVSFEAVRSED